ncbi:MAG: alanine racemase [Thermoanaerobaculia bacterium]
MTLSDLQTPAFLVDRDRVERNCRTMREKASRSNVVFRPHVKTHKTIEIGRMQHGGGIGPITVSTLAEADFFAAAGFRDITYAVPIAPEKLGRVASLAGRVERVSILLDDPSVLYAIEEFASAQKTLFDAFLELDCGDHRTGIDAEGDEAIAFGKRIAASPAVRFRGVLTHAGHSYHARSTDEIREIAREEGECVTRFASRLRDEGVEGVTRSVGSTPTMSVVPRFENTDEVRPGNYVFFDAFQATIGSCTLDDCAASVLTTVIGTYPGQNKLVVDAGAVAMSKDPGPLELDPEFGYGIVADTNLRPLPMRLFSLSQEHGQIRGTRPIDFDLYPIGTRLRIVPNHSCLTAALFDAYHVIAGGELVGEWRPVRGW